MFEAKKINHKKEIRYIDYEGMIATIYDNGLLIMIDMFEYFNEKSERYNEEEFFDQCYTLHENNYSKKKLSLDDKITMIQANWHLGLLLMTGEKGCLYIF